MDRDSDSEDFYPPEPKKPRLAEPAVPVVDQSTSVPIETSQPNNTPPNPIPSTSSSHSADAGPRLALFRASRLRVPVTLCDFCKSVSDPADTESCKLYCYLHHHTHPRVNGYYPMFELMSEDED